MFSFLDQALVKICGITSEGDALLAVGLGANALGFVFAPSPRQIAPRVVARIVERLPREILTVGVFRNEAPQRVTEIVNDIGLGCAQLHGDEPADMVQYVSARVPVTIKAFPAGHPGVASFDRYGAQLVLVDGTSPGSGEVFDWRLVEGVVDPGRMIVSGGLNARNVGDAIGHLRPRGVDVSSGVEAEPGRKDPLKLRQFVTAARRAFESVDDSHYGGTGEPGSSGHDDVGATPYDWQQDS